MKMVKNVVFFVQSILCETKLSLYKTKRQIMSFINIWTSRFQNIRPLSIGPLSTISTCVPLKSDFFIIHMCFLKKFHISVFKENWTVTRTGQKVCRSLQSKFQKMLSFYLIRPAQNIKQDQVSPLKRWHIQKALTRLSWAGLVLSLRFKFEPIQWLPGEDSNLQ